MSGQLDEPWNCSWTVILILLGRRQSCPEVDLLNHDTSWRFKKRRITIQNYRDGLQASEVEALISCLHPTRDRSFSASPEERAKEARFAE